MKNLSVFSKKMNRSISFQATNGRLVEVGAGDGTFFASAWTDKGWNNSGNWMDKGWNNSGNWMDKGWNNSGNWMDKGWNNSGSWSDGGWNNGSGGCFITTACLRETEKTDDCYELETMRFFRDQVCARDEGLRAMILDYYRIAPLLVQAIERGPDKEAVYASIKENMIDPCVSLIEQGDEEEAVSVYISSLMALREKYGY